MGSWKKITVLGICMIILLGFLLFFPKKEVVYNLSTYEKEIINYLKEISLQSEYDDSPQKVIKWRKPMMLYVVKSQDFDAQMNMIKKTIDKINTLASDGFRILLTDDITKSNSLLYLCSKEDVAKYDNNFYEMFSDGISYEIAGLSYTEFVTKTHCIDKALIFINSEYSLNIQESTILEELTQSIGLAFDSKTYSDSVFYKYKSDQEVRVSKYSKIDRDVIRLLYHSKIEPGLNPAELEKVVKEIFRSEKVKSDK